MKKILFLLLGCSFGLSAQLTIDELKIDRLVRPNAVDNPHPRFSWKAHSDKKRDGQSAYQVLVKEGKTTVWNSGKISSDQMLFVPYEGQALHSNSHYTVFLTIWNKNNLSANFQSNFSTGFMSSKDWKAQWINANLPADSTNGIVPILSKSFALKGKIKSARLYITSLGLYEATLNGSRVGDAYLSPGWTSYDHHLQYQVYDVAKELAAGNNSLEVKLGSGWYRTKIGWSNQKNYYGNETALLAQLEIEYADGKKDRIITDESWKSRPSAILFSEIYDGEIQDTRKTSGDWSSVKRVQNSYDILVSAINEPITKNQILAPKKLLISKQGDKILDFGQNFVGWAKIKIKGKPGQKIVLRHVEMLDKNGQPYYENLRSAKALATYILNGQEQVLEPHFTFYGFRYLVVEGLDEINLNDFQGIALYSNMKETGKMETDNALVNQLLSNIKWGQRGNFLDVPTDCPQRDERLGWTGDAEVFSRTAAFNYDVDAFFTKWLKDLAFDQFESGSVPHVIPDVLNKRNPRPKSAAGAAGWSDASIIIPYNLYTTYADKDLLRQQYGSMKEYLRYMVESSQDFLWNTGFQYADWLSYRVDDSNTMIGQRSAVTDNYLVAQAFFAYNCQLMIKTAKILGENADELRFKDYLQKVKEQFQKEYITGSGRLISETQTAYLLALAFDLIPEELRQNSVNRLVKNVKTYGHHLTTGFLGTPFLNPVLTETGNFEIADKLLMQETYPSWLYPIKQHGATTIWERWDSMKPDSTFQNPGMTSFNHYAYGAVGDWIYRSIGGIDTEEFGGAGYKESKVKIYVGTIRSAKASLDSPYGFLRTDWKAEGGKMELNLEVPFNTQSRIYLPEGFQEMEVDGEKIQGTQILVGSGKYKINFKK